MTRKADVPKADTEVLHGCRKAAKYAIACFGSLIEMSCRFKWAAEDIVPDGRVVHVSGDGCFSVLRQRLGFSPPDADQNSFNFRGAGRPCIYRHF
ncbi:hypothetical protein SUGI_0957340 [Cryptomeria japonica]|nr:hypothetical protein SUGI_0957340 [Cryptomeria japonica]